MLLYVYGNPDGTLVKIGKTRVPVAKRQRQFTDEARTCTVFLCAVKGEDTHETSIHRYFTKYRIPGSASTEVFRAEGELREWVAWLHSAPFAARTEEEADALTQHNAVSLSEYHPENTTRRAPPPETLPLGTWSDVLADSHVQGHKDYYTPKRYIDAAKRAMGSIDLDPATDPDQNRRFIRAPSIFTARTNGLEQPWHGNVWLNPPFGQWDLWCPKVAQEFRSGRVRQLVLLTNINANGNHNFAEMHALCAAHAIVRGRIAFEGPHDTGGHAAQEGHSLFYFGPAPARFADAFGDLAYLYAPARLAIFARTQVGVA